MNQTLTRTIDRSRPLALLLAGAIIGTVNAADEGAAFNKGGASKGYDEAVGSDSSPNAPITGGLYDTTKGVSVMVWGPIMALILGGVVAWMIFAIQKGGVFAAINSILALLIGGFAMSAVYTYMIAPAA